MDAQTRYRHAAARDRADAAMWNTNEGLARTALRRLQDRALRRQLGRLAQDSPFYQDKFAGIDLGAIRGIGDLPRLPFTVKTELRESLHAAPPFGRHLGVPIAAVVQMQASSGTTGSPSYVALTESDVSAWAEMTARTLFACGIRPGDLVLHAFSMAKGFVGGVPMFQALQYMGAIDIPVGADGGVDRLLRACADLRPRAIIGTPNFLLHLAEQAPAIVGQPAHALGVRRLVVGGEPGGGIPAIRAQLERAWGARCCELLGGTDLGVAYWAECDHQSGMHMVCEDHIITELLDPDTGTVIAFETGATGELVYTAIGREASALVRFRSGDHVEVLGTDCPCGRSGPRIRCVGRTDDMLIVRGVNVFPSAIQSVIADMVPQTNGVMRVLRDFDGHATQAPLKVIVERGPDADPADDPALKARIERHLRDALVFRADVRLTDPDTFDKPGVAKVALSIRNFP
ncbi:MAG: phenylacetate-CoA ligase [Rhodobacteraceae bacterium HLUCCA12]|nr:MAG: phenylacetate-CoA ligase [Rhodobacteraceae bacterium HLUCCA12]